MTDPTNTGQKKKGRRIQPPQTTNLYAFEPAQIREIITDMELDEMQKKLMRYRWLARVRHMEKDARKSKLRHYSLKLVIIAGSAVVPVLASLNGQPVVGSGSTAQNLIYYATLIVSVIVSISAGVHEFFSYGDRWRHYRGTVESLKSEGWHFIQQTGEYKRGNHQKNYRKFASNIEDLLATERERFMSNIAREPTEQSSQQDEAEGLTSLIEKVEQAAKAESEQDSSADSSKGNSK